MKTPPAKTQPEARPEQSAPLRLFHQLTVRLPASRKTTVNWTPPAKTVAEKGGKITVRFT